MRILLVEDTAEIAEALQYTLETQGYEFAWADTIRSARDLCERERFDLLLLDVTLPDGNGFDFYRRVASTKGIPSIFLTAKDEENDVVSGLEMGAEDYITKPFSTRELLARINRLKLRSAKEERITAGPITMDLARMEVTKDGIPVELTSLERKILHLLFQNHDKAVKRSEVIDLIWEATGNDVFDHTVTVYLKRIKDKLGCDIITTIKGVGYRIDT